MTKLEKQTLVSKQHNDFAQHVLISLAELSTATNSFCSSSKDVIELSRELVQETVEALTGFLQVDVFSAEGLEQRHVLLNQFHGIASAASVAEHSSVTLYSGQQLLEIDPFLPSPYYMAFQIDLALRNCATVLERYLVDVAPERLKKAELARIFTLGESLCTEIRERAREASLKNLEGAFQQVENPLELFRYPRAAEREAMISGYVPRFNK